ncbi:hypothetical protein LOTGIDRAFT_228177 [Lottia gigantea]|uniref:RPA43 OB domain-containing protein n=1 Tax=Lottia gigantea TaxID=225164 RepID=V4A100_LOTGI|nr:hypothetical protein LOTGIDRAFT_228177 [Lottia gigantea]ESO97493.1 hypothetical protein LOTGIDRAFT_228177 [Lottia gigantea]
MKSVGFKFEEAKQLLSDDNSYLYLITKSRTIILSPRFIGKILPGIREFIDREVNLFSDFLDGVLISYSNIKLHQPFSSVHDDRPYLHLYIQADYIVFKPYVGCTLKGVVNKLSQGHIGCLVHKHFNASVPRPFKNADKTVTICSKEMNLNSELLAFHPVIKCYLLKVP